MFAIRFNCNCNGLVCNQIRRLCCHVHLQHNQHHQSIKNAEKNQTRKHNASNLKQFFDVSALAFGIQCWKHLSQLFAVTSWHFLFAYFTEFSHSILFLARQFYAQQNALATQTPPWLVNKLTNQQMFTKRLCKQHY